MAYLPPHARRPTGHNEGGVESRIWQAGVNGTRPFEYDMLYQSRIKLNISHMAFSTQLTLMFSSSDPMTPDVLDMCPEDIHPVTSETSAGANVEGKVK